MTVASEPYERRARSAVAATKTLNPTGTVDRWQVADRGHVGSRAMERGRCSDSWHGVNNNGARELGALILPEFQLESRGNCR
jgi:hypothetical protein